ncbi:MAG: hypothetical protein PHT59_06505, partial [Candidatus Omnitrophica bacterium]|nr:hypothetical protein [Candidatus Omnitrophota bacterium]
KRARIEDMPALYSAHETVLHMPDKVGGGERVVFEAVLCGCKVAANGNAAHQSWREVFDWENPEILRERLARAPYEFWREVCRTLRP